jgi:hypothetical protein
VTQVDVAAVKRLRQAARQRRAARSSWSAARESLEALGPESVQDARMKSSSASRGNVVTTHEELTPALEAAGQLVAKLRRRVQIDERLHQLSDRRHVLDEQHRHFLDRQVLPTWVLGSLGVFFAFGIALIVGGVILPEAVTAPFGETLIGLGVIGSIAAVGLKIGIERRNKRGLETCRQQLATLRSQQHEAEQQRDELDRELPTGGGPLADCAKATRGVGGAGSGRRQTASQCGGTRTRGRGRATCPRRAARGPQALECRVASV